MTRSAGAPFRIVEETIDALSELDGISIAFDVASVLDVDAMDSGLGGIRLTERAVSPPYVKDYDVDSGAGPSRWSRHFDVSGWGIVGAWNETERIGSAVIAWHTPALHMLEDRTDLAVLWDLRVVPRFRGNGIGTALFGAAESWSYARGATQLKVETQNVNVGACRFYAKLGCTLGGMNRFAYPPLPDETQLLWYRDLRRGTA